MFTILKIQYRDNHLRIEFDYGDKLIIPIDISNQYFLETGKVIDKLEYNQLAEESARLHCKQKALNYLSIRSRSTFEMRIYLKKKNFSENIINETIAKLSESGYLNDYDYAVQYVKSRIKQKPTGKHLLKRDLQRKGISREIQNRALKEGGALEIDTDSIYELAKKKLLSLQNKKNKISKLSNFLYRRGFESSTINKIIGRLKQEEKNNLE